jgi:hypothetical protein
VKRLVGTAAPELVCIDCGGAPPIVLVGARGGGINLEPSPFLSFCQRKTPILGPNTGVGTPYSLAGSRYALAFVGDCSLRTTRGAAKKAPESPHSHGTLHEANGSGVHEANAARCADVSL